MANEHGARGELAILHEVFEPRHFEGAVFAIAATGDRVVNAQVAATGRERNVLVNVVDDMELSSFIVPAIVDRSPLVVAISTGGVAPVLARLVRERLESMLDGSLGTLAGLLERWRSRIKARLPDVDARRRFYEGVLRGRVAALLRSRQPGAAELEIERTLAAAAAPGPGSVVLVGAGPGDAGLLTLNALRALQEADVILHDRLVSAEVLQLARRDADRICVGKSAHGQTVAQERIHELLLEHARAGKRVVRLKGGDPFIFGRGGEEIDTLSAEGIPFEVVPGITAALGVAAYAGIPLTHRDYAQSVIFVTGHKKDYSRDLDWTALARPHQTVVVYMGLTDIEQLCSKLVEHGLPRTLPAAVVQQGTAKSQRVVTGTLATLARLAQRAQLHGPTLIIVGNVVRLRKRLNWFEPDAPA
jgi:uroporphyrin-III C-methyltransferase/precorrin-2 dehydrogenase/sirohydrochlorin ferrochelatase